MTTTPTFWSDDFLVNTHTNSTQRTPKITALPNGGFAIIWEEADLAQDPNGDTSVRVQRFDAAGSKVGGEIAVNGLYDQTDPDIVARADGGLTLVYTRQHAGVENIVVTDISPSGELSGSGVTSNSSPYADPALARLVSGDIIEFHVGSGGSPFANRFDPTGMLIGPFAVVSTPNADQNEPALAALANGGFVAVWDDDVDNRLEFRTFDALANPVSGDVVAATNGGSSIAEPAVAGLSNGNFIVVWSTHATTGFDTSGSSVYGQIFSPTGGSVSGEFLINTSILDSQSSPTVTALDDGGFMVVWQDASQSGSDSSGLSIRGQRFDANFGRLGSEFIINDETPGNQRYPDIAVLSDGRIAVT